MLLRCEMKIYETQIIFLLSKNCAQRQMLKIKRKQNNFTQKGIGGVKAKINLAAEPQTTTIYCTTILT